MSYCGTICHVPYASNGESNALVSAYGSSSLTGIAANYCAGGPVNCRSQLTGSELIIQPLASGVTIPGPILSSTHDPVAVDHCCSYTRPLSFISGSSYGGYSWLGYWGYGSYGGWRRYSWKCLPYHCGPY